MRKILILVLYLINIGFALENLGTYGKVYNIAEEDILDWIQKHSKLPQISKKEINKKVDEASTIHINLPIAKKDNIRKEKIIYTVPQDIVIEGKLIAKKGTKINVLKKIHLSKVYIVLADYMLKDFKHFDKETNTVFLITQGNIHKLDKKFKDLTIYAALPQVIKALRVKKIPSIVYQENDELVIYEKGYPNGSKKANTNSSN